jgi:hypothetical protein
MSIQFKPTIQTIIGIDIDAVVANTNRAIIQRLNKHFGLKLQLSDMVMADFVENSQVYP